MPRLLFTMALLALAGLSGGCGMQGSRLVPVSGKVTSSGKPLTQGAITFVADGSGSTAAGEIDAAGQYKLSTHKPGDGVAPGSYKVRIESWETPPRMDETGTNPGKLAVPEKYLDAQLSGLTATVTAGSGPQKINFDLVP